MGLIAHPKNKTFRCLQHQRDWRLDELLTVLVGGKVSAQCPDCVEEIDAVLAELVAGDDSQEPCVVHDGRGQGTEFQQAVGRCNKCGLAFCGDCLQGNGECVFCPIGST